MASSNAPKSIGGSATKRSAMPERGCANGQPPGVQRLAREQDRRAVQARIGQAQPRLHAVHRVADQWPAAIGQVHAQLMRPSR